MIFPCHQNGPVSQTNGEGDASQDCSRAGARPLTVLVVDDEEMIRDIMKQMLTRFGHKVLLAENGRKGLELYQKYKDCIGLIVLDMRMPDIPGYDALPALLSINPHVKVVCCSALDLPVNLKPLLKKGGIKYLGKPFTYQGLLQAVQDVMAP